MSVIGHYALERLLASSPESTVWRGRCSRPVDRPVALKQLTARTAEDAARQLEEIRALIALDHPHVVRVLDVLDGADGLTIVMQYAAGGSLADLLAARRRLDAGETVAVAAPLADALASAHRHGIVHGDVKPANVLFTADGEPLLADFASATRGTDGYIPPEVRDGARPDARADIYALGVVCVEALGHEIPSELAPVLDAAVASDPDDRPATAGELARLLRAAVPHSSVRLPGPAVAIGRGVGRPTRRFGPRPPVSFVATRRRPKAPLLVVPLLLVLCGLAFTRTNAAGPGAPPACAGPPLAAAAGAQVVHGDTAGIGCISTGGYAGQVLEIRVLPTDAKPRRFALGRPGDVLYLGDWDCDGIATPALLRPSTGASLYFDSWSSNERPTEPRGHCRTIR